MRAGRAEFHWLVEDRRWSTARQRVSFSNRGLVKTRVIEFSASEVLS